MNKLRNAILGYATQFTPAKMDVLCSGNPSLQWTGKILYWAVDWYLCNIHPKSGKGCQTKINKVRGNYHIKLLIDE